MSEIPHPPSSRQQKGFNRYEAEQIRWQEVERQRVRGELRKEALRDTGAKAAFGLGFLALTAFQLAFTGCLIYGLFRLGQAILG